MLMAGGSLGATTNGASPAQVEFGTNDVDVACLDFDQTTIEYATWNIALPDNWDGSTITAWFYYFTSVTSGTVLFDVAGRCYGDGDVIDAAITSWSAGSADTVPGTANYMAVTASTTFTPDNAADKGFTVIKVRRDTADTAAADARLLGVKLEYGINAFTD